MEEDEINITYINDIFHVLSSSKRREILMLLKDGPMYQKEIARELCTTAANVREHLLLLKAQNIVTEHKIRVPTANGQHLRKYYRLSVDLDIEGIERLIEKEIEGKNENVKLCEFSGGNNRIRALHFSRTITGEVRAQHSEGASKKRDCGQQTL